MNFASTYEREKNYFEKMMQLSIWRTDVNTLISMPTRAISTKRNFTLLNEGFPQYFLNITEQDSDEIHNILEKEGLLNRLGVMVRDDSRVGNLITQYNASHRTQGESSVISERKPRFSSVNMKEGNVRRSNDEANVPPVKADELSLSQKLSTKGGEEVNSENPPISSFDLSQEISRQTSERVASEVKVFDTKLQGHCEKIDLSINNMKETMDRSYQAIEKTIDMQTKIIDEKIDKLASVVTTHVHNMENAEARFESNMEKLEARFESNMEKTKADFKDMTQDVKKSNRSVIWSIMGMWVTIILAIAAMVVALFIGGSQFIPALLSAMSSVTTPPTP